jgi:hypothetical protein
MGIAAQIANTDIVAPNDEYVGLVRGGHGTRLLDLTNAIYAPATADMQPASSVALNVSIGEHPEMGPGSNNSRG